jgi:hypothetical protein
MSLLTRLSNVPIWILAPAILAGETVISAVLTAMMLDVLLRRPVVDGGSVTTLLPGFVYACATVMKVCIVGTLVAAIAGMAWRFSAKGRATKGVPLWGLVSLVLAPATPLIGTLVVVGIQRLFAAEGAVLASHFPPLARMAVFVMLAILSAGAMAAIASLYRSERPSMVPMLGLVVNLVLVVLFYRLRFYALGFDQDLWAPR